MMYSNETVGSAGLKKSKKYSFASELVSDRSLQQQTSQDQMSSGKNVGSMSYKQRQKAFDQSIMQNKMKIIQKAERNRRVSFIDQHFDKDSILELLKKPMSVEMQESEDKFNRTAQDIFKVGIKGNNNSDVVSEMGSFCIDSSSVANDDLKIARLDTAFINR